MKNEVRTEAIIQNIWRPKGGTSYAQIPNEVVQYVTQHFREGSTYLYFYLHSYAQGRETLSAPISYTSIAEELSLARTTAERQVVSLRRQGALTPIGYYNVGTVYRVKVPVKVNGSWEFVEPSECHYLQRDIGRPPS